MWWPDLLVGLSLQWRHNDHDSVSNHQPHGCLLNRLFRRRSKKTSKLRVTGLCVGNSPRPVNSPHKGPVTRKMFPFDDVIMVSGVLCQKQVPRAGTSNYIPQILWDVITFPCPWYLLLAQQSSYTTDGCSIAEVLKKTFGAKLALTSMLDQCQAGAE